MNITRIFDLAAKDIVQTLRDRMSLLFLLIMPVAFTLLFAFAFGGSSAPSDARLPVGYLDLDQTHLSAVLKTELQTSSVIRLDGTGSQTAADLETLVAQGDLAAAVIVPAGYSAQAASAQPARLTVITGSGSGAITAQGAIQSAAWRVMSAMQTAALSGQPAGASTGASLDLAMAAWSNPPVRLTVSNASAAPVANAQNSGSLPVSHTAPGMMLQFGIAGLLSAAQVLVHERKTNCLQRLMTTSMRRPEILAGHFLAIFLTTLVQFTLLIVFGQVALKLNYFAQPLATLVITLTCALFLAGLGLLIGAVAKTDEQAIIAGLLSMFVFAGLGGAWVPLENTGRALQVIGHFTPVAWAMDGFSAILVRGAGLAAIWLPAAALLGYALLFGSLAIWKFRYE